MFMQRIGKGAKVYMPETYKTIERQSIGEFVEKKSRFIACAAPAATEEAACAFIDQIRRKHYDARHNCFAFSIGVDMPVLRFSDDGEPQGTAGKPILEVITGAEVSDICIVVTRYFGGTLLGTGGLVRAYTEAARLALADNDIITKTLVVPAEFLCDYTDLGKLQYTLASENIQITDTVYGEQVVVKTNIPADMADRLDRQITEATAARARLIRKGDLLWA